MNETKLLQMLEVTAEECLIDMESADKIGDLKCANAKVSVLLTVLKRLNSRNLLDDCRSLVADSIAEELRTRALKIYQQELEELEKCEK